MKALVAAIALIGLLIPGCTEKQDAVVDPEYFFLGEYNDSGRDFHKQTDFSFARGGNELFVSHHGVAVCGSAANGQWHDATFWMRVTLREPGETEVVHGNPTGPVVFMGNWTGLECGHRYVFRLLDSAFETEVYEDLGKGKKRFLEAVPP